MLIAVFFRGLSARGNRAGRRSRKVTAGKRATRAVGAGSPLTARRALPGRSVEADIASRGTIDMALSGLTREETIRRIRRGLYDRPKFKPALGGKLSPDIDEAARAIARRQRWKIVPEGAWAANLLGLSSQVPSKIIYLTDGPNHEVPIGRRVIHFKHARPKSIAGSEGKFALVVQALRYLGKGGVGLREIKTLRAGLSLAEKGRLVKDTRFGVEWIYEVAKKIAEKAA